MDTFEPNLPASIPTLYPESPFSRGIERILNSVAASIDRGEFIPLLIVVGGLSAGMLITVSRGGTVSFSKDQ